MRDPGIHSALPRLLKLSTINTLAQTRTELAMTGREVNQYLQITGMISTTGGLSWNDFNPGDYTQYECDA